LNISSWFYVFVVLAMVGSRPTMLSLVQTRVQAVAPRLAADLSSPNAISVIDEFLGKESLLALRQEAEAQRRAQRMSFSKSTRYDPVQKRVVEYQKHNVESMQVAGGNRYDEAPLLTEYVVGLVGALHANLHPVFPHAALSPSLASNKLAVCTGNGSSYDKHYDNSGGEDLRKLTALYYLNPGWSPEQGGCFRVFKSLAEHVDVAPRGDRLVCFWSDRVVHSVSESFAPKGESDHRWALTVWMTTTDPASVYNGEDVKLHFPDDLTPNPLNHY
jgi:Rps23 Pro-64 3,4-dihydroxylase Tpa1-like proline 4-hydroxylase